MLLQKTSASETPHADMLSMPAHSPSCSERKRIDSLRLLEGARELVIDHRGCEYHLRLTRNDKLILTK
jgi:hemin uptake protein HemP